MSAEDYNDGYADAMKEVAEARANAGYVIQKKTKCEHPIWANRNAGENYCSQCRETPGYTYEEVPLMEALAEIENRLVRVDGRIVAVLPDLHPIP